MCNNKRCIGCHNLCKLASDGLFLKFYKWFCVITTNSHSILLIKHNWVLIRTVLFDFRHKTALLKDQGASLNPQRSSGLWRDLFLLHASQLLLDMMVLHHQDGSHHQVEGLLFFTLPSYHCLFAIRDRCFASYFSITVLLEKLFVILWFYVVLFLCFYYFHRYTTLTALHDPSLQNAQCSSLLWHQAWESAQHSAQKGWGRHMGECNELTGLEA